MACIGYGNSVCLSVRPSVLVSQPVTVSRPGEIETSGFHHMIALVSSILWQNFMPLGEGVPWTEGRKMGKRKYEPQTFHKSVR